MGLWYRWAGGTRLHTVWSCGVNTQTSLSTLCTHTCHLIEEHMQSVTQHTQAVSALHTEESRSAAQLVALIKCVGSIFLYTVSDLLLCNTLFYESLTVCLVLYVSVCMF